MGTGTGDSLSSPSWGPPFLLREGMHLEEGGLCQVSGPRGSPDPLVGR